MFVHSHINKALGEYYMWHACVIHAVGRIDEFQCHGGRHLPPLSPMKLLVVFVKEIGDSSLLAFRSQPCVDDFSWRGICSKQPLRKKRIPQHYLS